jgi:hypothetical protein
MRIRTITLSLVALLATLIATSAKAQEWPGYGGLNDIYQMNMAFDQQFDQQARIGAWQAALATPNDQPLPFNAMTISQSISAGNDAALGYVRSSQYNSNRALGAVERWDTGAIQGNWYYGNGSGQTYVLPYQYNSYYQSPTSGYFYGGYQYGGNNYYVNHGWGR